MELVLRKPLRPAQHSPAQHRDDHRRVWELRLDDATQHKFHLFDWKRIESTAERPRTRDPDGREFWKKYKEIMSKEVEGAGKEFTPDSLANGVIAALVAGTKNDWYCPPALRGDELI